MEPQNNTKIYWSLINHREWKMYLAATEKGLCFVGSQNKPFDEVTNWAEKVFPGSILEECGEKLQAYAVQITEYLEGKRKSFSIPFDYNGTEFQVAVWKALCNIPYGETKTYSDIAQHIQKPAAVRAVGAAIGKNPVLITVPCHRVVGKDGSLTGFRGGLDMKKQLLELERSCQL
ncbi:methylated-DNA--[protein]-cysteine S-methyltransferase [Niallia endozanthoxylica]|uniref:Methylated-DNA--protein-cysteine methyltransferase n=1 Tax=Niallia endozanthoxylica TaxID=2036016 RepID=A0A5J5H0B8_9BACI|nr:methylated-DNA--[protein]-cysteine S-methyltransferase [Niallia endozanthoxylica]KAA9014049.1 methylated-DNA--[protein]-cysteine S-methyltransferase [Niallia endozanthoxylica]